MDNKYLGYVVDINQNNSPIEFKVPNKATIFMNKLKRKKYVENMLNCHMMIAYYSCEQYGYVVCLLWRFKANRPGFVMNPGFSFALLRVSKDTLSKKGDNQNEAGENIGAAWN